eukprot:9497751-Pyramimonas_sp.AAC.1
MLVRAYSSPSRAFGLVLTGQVPSLVPDWQWFSVCTPRMPARNTAARALSGATQPMRGRTIRE